MIVMPAQNSKGRVHYWAGKGFPVGWLFTPEGGIREPVEWIPYAIDNGRFAVWSSGGDWNERKYMNCLEEYSSRIMQPRWIVVPDSVGDRDETLREWERWHPVLESNFNLEFAFVAQDGMTPEDVPSEATIVFVGGTSVWKWRNLQMWVENFERVHVGAVNSLKALLTCEEKGVESVDGTGWFRSPHRSDVLEKFFKIQAGEESLPDQMTLALA